MQIDRDKMPIIVICWVKLKFDHGIRSANIDFVFSDAKLQTDLILEQKICFLWYKNPGINQNVQVWLSKSGQVLKNHVVFHDINGKTVTIRS
jgi:hypothetical protein